MHRGGTEGFRRTGEFTTMLRLRAERVEVTPSLPSPITTGRILLQMPIRQPTTDDYVGKSDRRTCRGTCSIELLGRSRRSSGSARRLTGVSCAATLAHGHLLSNNSFDSSLWLQAGINGTSDRGAPKGFAHAGQICHSGDIAQSEW